MAYRRRSLLATTYHPKPKTPCFFLQFQAYLNFKGCLAWLYGIGARKYGVFAVYFKLEGNPVSCLCSQLDAITKVESQPGLFGSLTAIEYGYWVKLCRCEVCGQLWSIDECDKGNIAFAKKLSSESNWQVQNIEEQKAYLLKARGGTENKVCAQSGCQNLCLKGVAFCVDHYFAMGWRE